jgi:hypothetical protein
VAHLLTRKPPCAGEPDDSEVRNTAAAHGDCDCVCCDVNPLSSACAATLVRCVVQLGRTREAEFTTEVMVIVCEVSQDVGGAEVVLRDAGLVEAALGALEAAAAGGRHTPAIMAVLEILTRLLHTSSSQKLWADALVAAGGVERLSALVPRLVAALPAAADVAEPGMMRKGFVQDLQSCANREFVLQWACSMYIYVGRYHPAVAAAALADPSRLRRPSAFSRPCRWAQLPPGAP